MTSERDENVPSAVTDSGSSTDQQISGYEEEGSFLTDEAPTPATPAHGSSNAGVNETGANRPGGVQD
ncbi:hypothetical protein COUCH_23520 [Couchioplanes caeruleus]|uniref:hypothetical protein n=1 Tax=Couchioplanes caeruleus TaxID=56438 RepID=UPI0020C12B19|nr:hypothetical protein [Couchioplanes caeruleus]UQU62010.1 hypothetical protein COUCH_23520 [Couchioplanes caeruleus]